MAIGSVMKGPNASAVCTLAPTHVSRELSLRNSHGGRP